MKQLYITGRRLGWLLATLIIGTLPNVALAATSTDGMWTDVASDRVVSRGVRATIPDRFRTSRVDLAMLTGTLERAPAEGSNSGVRLALPMPDGSFTTFQVFDSPIMAPDLAKQFPKMRTFVAVAEDDASTTARLDLTPAGFHAMILSTSGTVYIDPYQSGSDLDYISYDKRAYSKNREPYYCAVTGKMVDGDHSPLEHVRTPVGDTLRTYRLAVAATGEYTAFHGGTVGGAQAAIVTTINRVSGIYERDLAARLQLIGNNTSVIYTNSITDPYTNSNGFAMLAQNQAVMDTVIGNANYDIGHVVSTGGGGVAGLGVVCTTGQKGRGVTGSNSPIGDSFDVDFVAHEIGHQFGGNHTFNGTTGSCGGGNRNGSTAYEPGSGTTIQAYAGICGAENIQPNSDDNFHGVSFDEMTGYMAGSGNCSVNTATGNTAPTVDAGAGFTVPFNTPLLLGNEATVSDPNAGQALTYSWEQFDLGTPSPPNTDNGNRPLFRSFTPKPTPIRFLPQMADILSNGTTLGESLPTTNRALNFRLTVRDNAPGGGGVDNDSLTHTVTTAAGPFRVTSQATPTIWPANSAIEVTWNVAGTNGAPVNCANVTIIVSNQGFASFSGTTLAANSPNDGSEMITNPGLTLSGARLMVKCTTNVFFDVNDADIDLVPAGPGDCGNGLLDAGEQCDDGNIADTDGCSATCQVEDGFTCTAPTPPSPGTEVLPDGGFESGSPSAVWAEASTNFGTPLCTDAFCGTTNGPNSGTWFTWFGGIAAVESGSVEQTFVIQPDDQSLTFARRIVACDSQPDVVRLRIDGNEVWFADGASPDCGQPSYTTETIDLATAPGGPYNDGAPHLIRFESVIFANNGGGSSFFIDDASILRGATDGQPSVCTASGPPNDDYANFIILPDEGQVTGTLVGATNDGNNTLDPSNADVWYVYTSPILGTLRLNTCGSNSSFGTDTIVSLHTNDGMVGTVANQTLVNDDYQGGIDITACDGPGGSSLDSAFALAVTPTTVIVVRVSDFDDAGDQFVINTELLPEFVDTDGDTIGDDMDNCVAVPNVGQLDTNGDGFGNICDADLNNDCIVNVQDLGIFRSQFFMSGANDADFNGDNTVNVVDLGILRAQFFGAPGPSGLATCDPQ